MYVRMGQAGLGIGVRGKGPAVSTTSCAPSPSQGRCFKARWQDLAGTRCASHLLPRPCLLEWGGKDPAPQLHSK